MNLGSKICFSRKPDRGRVPLMAQFECDDPRILPGYNPGLMPQVDGLLDPGIQPANRFDMARLEFVAAYYQVNKLQLEKEEGNESSSMLSLRAQCLERIRALNDFYQPYGIYCSPIIVKGWVKALQIMVPPLSNPAPDTLKISSSKTEILLA